MSIHDYPPLITVKSVHADGLLALYTGPFGNGAHLDLGDQIVTTSDTDLAPLAKAILNAVEPEALVENQPDATPPAQEFDVPALVAAVNDLQDRVADLEAASDNEIRVGDTVRVHPDEWNIGGSFIDYRTVNGEVKRINPPRPNVGRPAPAYLVEFEYPFGHEHAGTRTSIWALSATKVGSRG